MASFNDLAVNSPHQRLDSKHCFWPTICDALSPVFLGQHLSPVTSSALKLEYSRCFQSDIPISMCFANITWILHCSLLIIVFSSKATRNDFQWTTCLSGRAHGTYAGALPRLPEVGGKRFATYHWGKKVHKSWRNFMVIQPAMMGIK